MTYLCFVAEIQGLQALYFTDGLFCICVEVCCQITVDNLSVLSGGNTGGH